jgi:hypothetical protein
MSDSALNEVITTMMVKPNPYLGPPMDAIAALPDGPRQHFGRALKQITDQRDSDRAYLLSTTRDPARRQQFADADAYDVQMGLDWPTLQARLRL